MKALVYHGPGRKAWEDVPDATIKDDTDAVVRVDTVTICGTDLHILKGDTPEVTDGRILGHEAVGTVVSVGLGRQDGRARRPGARVLRLGVRRCRFCRESRFGQCLGGGGWILGYMIDGTQAEYVRVPFADTSTYQVPAGRQRRGDPHARRHPADQLRGRSPQRPRGSPATPWPSWAPGRSACPRSWQRGCSRPAISWRSIWPTPGWRRPRRFGADLTVNNGREDAVESVGELTDGLGADVAIEAVGMPATFELCTELVRPGGRVANIGVHGAPATFTWSRCGSVTSRSRPAWWTRTPRRRCCAWSRHGRSSRHASSRTASSWTTSCRPTTCSPTRPTPVLSKSS